jgi:hypothetical protein
VNNRCTCGATLIDGALFCHKCGRPLRELPDVHAPDETPEVAETVAEPVRVEPVAPVAAPPDVATPADVSLRNRFTVQASLVGACFQFLAMMLLSAAGAAVAQISPLLAGGIACHVFQRKSHLKLGVMQGARLGWFTGVMSFLLVMILITATFALAHNEAMMSEVRAAASASEIQKNALTVMEKLRDEPGTLLVVLPFQFLVLTLLGSLGGALYAKLMQPKD